MVGWRHRWRYTISSGRVNCQLPEPNVGFHASLLQPKLKLWVLLEPGTSIHQNCYRAICRGLLYTSLMTSGRKMLLSWMTKIMNIWGRMFFDSCHYDHDFHTESFFDCSRNPSILQSLLWQLMTWANMSSTMNEAKSGFPPSTSYNWLFTADSSLTWEERLESWNWWRTRTPM